MCLTRHEARTVAVYSLRVSITPQETTISFFYAQLIDILLIEFAFVIHFNRSICTLFSIIEPVQLNKTVYYKNTPVLNIKVNIGNDVF